jgi:hypothetical protein
MARRVEMKTRWLFVPFMNDDEVFAMARDWKKVEDWKGKRTVIARFRNGNNCLASVVDGDVVYVLGHGNVGCDTIANKFEAADEELSVIDLCNRIESSGLTQRDDVVMKLYSCSAGASSGSASAGCSGKVFARSFASRLKNAHYYWNLTIYGYTETVTAPTVDGDGNHRRAQGSHGGDLGRARDFRVRFDGY